MKSKNERQEMIVKLIKENTISTQEELTRRLNENGFETNQSAVSRDLKDLGVIKVNLPGHNCKYSLLERTGQTAPKRLLAVFTNSLISANVAMNLVVVKTLPGMAQAAASAFDSIHLPNVVGTIGGDDTVFIATSSIEDANALVETIDEMIKTSQG